MWDNLLNKPNQGNPFIEFGGELMNVGINYYHDIEKTNTSDRIAGVKVEGDKLSNTGTKSYPTARQSERGVGRRG